MLEELRKALALFAPSGKIYQYPFQTDFCQWLVTHGVDGHEVQAVFTDRAKAEPMFITLANAIVVPMVERLSERFDMRQPIFGYVIESTLRTLWSARHLQEPS